MWLILCLLLIYVALFEISSLFFFELFLVTFAVARSSGSRDTNYVTVSKYSKNIFHKKILLFLKTFLYREHVKKDWMYYSALIVKIFFVILFRAWMSL